MAPRPDDADDLHDAGTGARPDDEGAARDDRPVEPAPPPGPDAEDPDGPQSAGEDGDADAAVAPATADPLGDVDARFAGIVAGLQAEARPRSWTLDSTTAEVDDSHFEPPDPGPVLGGDPLLTVAWVAVLALPLVLLLGVLVWNPLPGLVLQVCVVGFLAGLALLLWRMPRHRDDDDPGAVV